MLEVNLHEAKTHLSKLVTQATMGEEVIISRYGKPTVRLTPITTAQKERRGGRDRGLFQVPANFDERDSELEKLFES